MAPRRRLPEWARSRSRPRDRSTGYLKPRRCDLYLPGHTVHWIQAMHSLDDEPAFGRLVDIEGGVLTLDMGHSYRAYRSHEPERLAEIVDLGRGVYLFERFALLRPYRYGGYSFSIARADKAWRECTTNFPDPTDPEAIARALNEDGGFTVRGRDVLGWTSRS